MERIEVDRKEDFPQELLEVDLIQLPMCLHENLSFPLPLLASMPCAQTEKRMRNHADFSFLFSQLTSPDSESARTTPESFTYSRGNTPNIPFSLHCQLGALLADVALDLKFEVVFKYFTLLLDWARDAMNTVTSVLNRSPLLLYEDMYCTFNLYEDALYSAVEHNTDIALLNSCDSYLLLVKGSSQAVQDRVDCLDKMIADALKVRKIHHLSGWHEKHCDALAASDHLKHMQTATRACVLFRALPGTLGSSEVSMIAEVASLQPYQTSGLVKALNTLLPTMRVLEVTGDPMAYAQVPWAKLSTTHAVVSDWTGGSGSALLHSPPVIHMWGFEGFIDNAVTEIQALIGVAPVSVTIGIPKPIAVANPWKKSLPATVTQACVIPVLQCARSASVSSITTAVTNATSATIHATAAEAAAQTDNISKNFVGTYSFRDREAGIFFYAFEKQFHAYIQSTFSVIIAEEDFKESKKDVDDGNRNAILKISFYGTTQLSVSATRSYLDQLNPHNLHRVQVFLPMVSVSKYKELLTRRSIELSSLSEVRHNSLQKLGGTLTAHPTVDPMQFHGAINIRIKPPMHSGGVSRIPLPADCTVTISGSILVKEHLEMIQAIGQRFNDIPSEHYVETLTLPFGHPLKKQLVVKASRDGFVKQHNLMGLKLDEGTKATGSVAVVKMWANTRAIMNATLTAINAVTESWTPCSVPAVPPLEESEHWPPLTNKDASGESVAGTSKAVLCWPHPALRYALLSNPLSGELNELLKKWTDAGLACKYPYRDRTNPNAGILLQGSELLVPQGSLEVGDFLQASANALKCVHIIVPHQVYSNLIAKDLAGVKFIQGQAGVYMGMNCSMDEVHQDAHSMVDMRLSSTRNCLLSLRVDNTYAHHSLDVIVVASASSDVGLSWGAKHELIILEADGEVAGTFSQRDEEQLMNGRVQIHTDAQSCKTVLRVMLLKQSKDSNGKVPDFEANVNRVVKGLEKADALSLKGLSVVMSHNLCATGLAAVIKFARKCYSVHSLSRIVCIELLANDRPLKPTVAVGSGSFVAEAMLKLVEEKQRVAANNITLLTANTALPVQMKVASYGQQMARYSQGPKSTTGSFPTVSGAGSKWSGDQSVLVRGIESSVLKALDSLKEMLRSGRGLTV